MMRYIFLHAWVLWVRWHWLRVGAAHQQSARSLWIMTLTSLLAVLILIWHFHGLEQVSENVHCPPHRYAPNTMSHHPVMGLIIPKQPRVCGVLFSVFFFFLFFPCGRHHGLGIVCKHVALFSKLPCDYFFPVRALQIQFQAQMGPSRYFHLNSVSLLGLWLRQEQSRSSAKFSCRL